MHKDGGSVKKLEFRVKALEDTIKWIMEELKVPKAEPCSCGDGFERDVNGRVVYSKKTKLRKRCSVCNGKTFILKKEE